MDISNNLAIVLIAFKLKLDENGYVHQQAKNDVQRLVESFGDGMTPWEFYRFLETEDQRELI